MFEVVGSKVSHKMEICGSYRRGSPTCGDIDIIFTRQDGVFEADLLSKLVLRLQGSLLTDALTDPSKASKDKDKRSNSYMGICQLPGGIHRRIDMKNYPLEEFGFAILYFTGSDMFNRWLRIVASKKGFTLSDHGLVPSGSTDRKSVVVCPEEKDVF